MASVRKSESTNINSITGKSRAETRAEAKQKVGIRRVPVPSLSRMASPYIELRGK